MPFLEKEFPKLAQTYKQRYGNRAYLPKGYGERISQLMSKLREKYGMLRRQSRREHYQPPPLLQEQMNLF